MRNLLWAFSFLALSSLGCGPEYPNCDNDEDCHEAEFCVNDQCQQCRDDSNCPAGNRCNEGRCDPIEDYCTGAGDCETGEDCENNHCVRRQSTTDPNAGQNNNNGSNAACTLDPIHFDFDSDELSPAARDALARHARCIRDRNIARVHVTGFTDPQGTEEYNLALGDRRARSVAQYLTSLGVAADHLTNSSMGEEAASGEDEAGWAQDRRATFTEQ